MTTRAALIRWCADQVRSTDNSQAVLDAADYLDDRATEADADEATVQDRSAVIRWCATQVHSMGGDYTAELAADHLDDLATEETS
ncbi:hypothetical protein [Streptomyces sp. CAU 1734]|uniref:hypothetical protein n=1 Tax=Streptomyces sp. CAU 1734 TaxID=3140360 RepID=UPI003260FB2E